MMGDAGQLRVGVVGAGPWSKLIHTPMVANHPRVTLAGVWARRREAAEDVAFAYDAPAFTSFDALLDNCDALSFALPPDVQADLATVAARAGKALLLEKPLALDVDRAAALVDVIADTGVPTQLDLTWRYADVVRTFLKDVRESQPIGGWATFVTDAYLAGMFATPWRLEHGPLLDVGPHLIDLLEAALGEVVDIRAHGDLNRWIGLLLEHATGLASEVSICAYAPIGSTGSDGAATIRAGAQLYTSRGAIGVDTSDIFDDKTTTRIIDEFIETAERRSAHVLDAEHGLHLQKLLATAISQVTSR